MRFVPLRLLRAMADDSAADNSLYIKKIGAAVFYGVASFMITVVNKTVLTTYLFPSYQFLGLGQILTTILVLAFSRALGILTYPPLERNTFARIWPLPLVYLGNMVTGLGGTKELSLPMFTALRRFSILMTMIAERIVLGVRATLSVKLSVLAMVGGALLAAADDVTFTLTGYTLVLINDAFTASNGVLLKKKLDAKDLGKYGLMYYNSLFMLAPATMVAWATGDLHKSYEFPDWSDPLFLAQFLMSCVMGFVLSYSVMLCTFFNGALTTTIIGCLKNISVTYLGMVIGGDYVFSPINFVGLNISVLGSVFYTYVTFRKKQYAPLKESPEAKIDVV